MPHGMDKKIFRKLKKKKKKRIHQGGTVFVLTRGPQLRGQLFVMFDQQGRLLHSPQTSTYRFEQPARTTILASGLEFNGFSLFTVILH